MDPDPDSDPTPFFIDFKDVKKILHFFLITCPQAQYLQSKKFNFCKNFVLKFYFADIISVRSTHLEEKKKDPDPYLRLMDPDPDLGGPKTCGFCGSGSPTLSTVYTANVGGSGIWKCLVVISGQRRWTYWFLLNMQFLKITCYPFPLSQPEKPERPIYWRNNESCFIRQPGPNLIWSENN